MVIPRYHIVCNELGNIPHRKTGIANNVEFHLQGQLSIAPYGQNIRKGHNLLAQVLFTYTLCLPGAVFGTRLFHAWRYA